MMPTLTERKKCKCKEKKKDGLMECLACIRIRPFDQLTRPGFYVAQANMKMNISNAGS